MGSCFSNHFQVSDEDIPSESNGSDNPDGPNGSDNPDGSNGSDNPDGPNGSDNPDGSNESANLITRYFDWHNQDEPIFWPIEEQTGDFCWVHAVVDTLEGLYAITHNRQRIKLSKQEIVDKLFVSNELAKYNSSSNTYSISMEDAYNWIIDNGLSLEQDYGSGKYEATLQVPKDRIPGCPIFNLTGVRRIYSSSSVEDRILEKLDNAPGAAVLIMDRSFKETDAVYSIPADARKDVLHGVVISGYDDTGSRKVYWVRDSLKSRAPNQGHYRVSRASGVQSGEGDPIEYVLFPVAVSLSESSTITE